MRTDGEISGLVIRACMEVHTRVGPGLLESVYQRCVARELMYLGVPFQQQMRVPLAYRDMALKSVDSFHPIHVSQMLTYLRTTKFPIGLLINFNVPHLKHGIRRLTPNKTSVSPPTNLTSSR